MKNNFIGVFIIFLMLSMSGVAGASQIWATGVTTTNGWLDADKDWTDDTQLCWAASASNMLSWGKWDGGPGLVTEENIFDDFESYWNDDVGNPWYAVDWWFTGTNDHQGDAGWAQLTDTSHTGFYSDPLFTTNMAWTSGSDLTGIAGYLTAGRAVSLRISDGTLGHFLTVWGIDSDTGDLWVTDSDRNIDQLDHYTVTGSTLDGGYSRWDITSYYGLNPNTGDIDPTLRDAGVVPEPSTMVLFGLGLIGLIGINRKK